MHADLLTQTTVLLLLISIFMHLPFIHKARGFLRIVLMISIGFLCVYFPSPMSILKIVIGIVGNLSVSLLLFLIIINLKELLQIPLNINKKAAFLISLVGVVFYLSLLLVIKTNLLALITTVPNLWMMVGVFILGIAFIYLDTLFGIIFLVSLLAYYLNLQSSINLSAYMIDPVLWLICTVYMCYPHKSAKLEDFVLY